MPAGAGPSAPGTASAWDLWAAEWRREKSSSSAQFGSGCKKQVSNWSWDACTRAGGCRHQGGHKGVHARGRSIAHGVGTVCAAMVSGGIACLPFRRGDLPGFLMLGYIRATQWAGEPARIIPGGWDWSVGLLVP